MRVWRALDFAERCGNCESTIEKGEERLIVTGDGWRKARCTRCGTQLEETVNRPPAATGREPGSDG